MVWPNGDGFTSVVRLTAVEHCPTALVAQRAAVKSKTGSVPLATRTAPEGAIEPPASALAVIVKLAGTPASAGVPVAAATTRAITSSASMVRGCVRGDHMTTP